MLLSVGERCSKPAGFVDGERAESGRARGGVELRGGNSGYLDASGFGGSADGANRRAGCRFTWGYSLAELGADKPCPECGEVQ